PGKDEVEVAVRRQVRPGCVWRLLEDQCMDRLRPSPARADWDAPLGREGGIHNVEWDDGSGFQGRPSPVGFATPRVEPLGGTMARTSKEVVSDARSPGRRIPHPKR